MSASDTLLIFLDAHDGIEGWLRLGADGVVARGPGLDDLPPLVDPDSAEPLKIVAVVPGETVSLHWLELPGGLAPAQAAAAARMMAAEVSAQPIDDMHVAVAEAGEDEGGTLRIIALVPALAMTAWLARLQAAGIDPEWMLPEPLLLKRPEAGFVRYARGAVPVHRGASDAFALEPELAALIIGDAPVETIDAEAFEAGLAEAVAAPAINLRQGAFARKHGWKIDWKIVRRLAWLGFGILIVTLAIQMAAILRYTQGADALEAEAEKVAASALPRGTRIDDPARQLTRRLAELRGGGAGFGAVSSALFEGIRATPGAQLSAMNFERDGSLRATIQGDAPATIAAVQQRLEAGGFAVDAGPMRTGGGQPTAELTVRGR